MNNRQQNTTTIKPELLLKRVNELIGSAVGNSEREKRLALDQLHAVIGVKKKVTWSKIYESLMKKHIELCVDLKDHLTAKDGLHQYRNLCQNVDPSSLELIILYLLELSEGRALAARQKADKVALSAAARVSDLEQEETPESIMLSSMTEEGAKERTDREVVVPWLKFLWENYRAILELLYKLPKLEKVYHKTCEKAFKFCSEYSRMLEFKRLCDMLRTQLANLQKVPTNNLRAATRPAWEWTPEAVEYHLQTRFHQLEVATSMELWNEGFRTVEDIYAIMTSGKKTPKPKLMITYYEKLTRIFWVSDNKLFHAYAWLRYFTTVCESRKDLKPEERTLMASSVLLSALSVPNTTITHHHNALGNTEDDEIIVEKNSQMALLLDFQVNPSRQSLLQDIVSQGILNEVLPELSTLYEQLEVKFQPLQLIKNVSNAIHVIKANPSLSLYAVPLQKILVLKVIQQLSRCYSTIRIDYVNKLFSTLPDLTATSIEKILIEAVANRTLQLRFNHVQGSIQFASNANNNSNTQVVVAENQVSTLGKVLSHIRDSIGATNTTEREANTKSRKEYFQLIQEQAENELNANNDRKNIIERRKEGLERLQQEKLKEEKAKKELEEAKRRKEEDERLEKEEYARNLEKKKKAQEKVDINKIQKELERYGVFKEESEIVELDVMARKQLIIDAQNESMKAKDEETRRLLDQAKKLDYITRALRMESFNAVRASYEAKLKEDIAAREAKHIEIVASAKEKHAIDIIEKQRLSNIQPHRSKFEDVILAKQKILYDKQFIKLRQKAIQDKRDENIAKARRLYHEELERIEMEEEMERQRKAKEERDILEQEQAARLRKQREEEELAERRQESDLEKMKRQIAEAEKLKATGSSNVSSGRPTPTNASSGGDKYFGSSNNASSDKYFGSSGGGGDKYFGSDRDNRGGSGYNRGGGDRDREDRGYDRDNRDNRGGYGGGSSNRGPPRDSDNNGGGGGWSRVGGGGGGGRDSRGSSSYTPKESNADSSSAPPPAADKFSAAFSKFDSKPSNNNNSSGGNWNKDNRDNRGPPARRGGDKW